MSEKFSYTITEKDIEPIFKSDDLIGPTEDKDNEWNSVYKILIREDQCLGESRRGKYLRDADLIHLVSTAVAKKLDTRVNLEWIADKLSFKGSIIKPNSALTLKLSSDELKGMKEANFTVLRGKKIICDAPNSFHLMYFSSFEENKTMREELLIEGAMQSLLIASQNLDTVERIARLRSIDEFDLVESRSRSSLTVGKTVHYENKEIKSNENSVTGSVEVNVDNSKFAHLMGLQIELESVGRR